ncbi:MAG TPA: G1 family glutamic endopeptidase [Solirubrobacteraceae bacterium]|nr:G1 family glutamic endopeptidase [Solirubrobacteraceae bacterium]
MGLLGPAAVAQANTNTSINWSGYAVHRSGIRFHRVAAVWRMPSGSCAPGAQGFSAFWVGLGGYRLNSQALEQVGTEFDCTMLGRPEVSVWYELVPAPSHTVRMVVHPGDLVSAWVIVHGIHVTIGLIDRTDHHRFRKQIIDRHADLTSAEWIAEAPSECLGIANCSVLPLADFGSVSFMHAYAQANRHRAGGISSHHWNRTRILLANTNGRRYVSGNSASAHATPSVLHQDGRAFSITFSGPGHQSTVVGGQSSVAGTRSRAQSASAEVRPQITVLGRQG